VNKGRSPERPLFMCRRSERSEEVQEILFVRLAKSIEVCDDAIRLGPWTLVRANRGDQIRRAAVVQEEEALSQPRPIDAAPPGWSLDGCGGARKRMSWTGGARARGARVGGRCRTAWLVARWSAWTKSVAARSRSSGARRRRAANAGREFETSASLLLAGRETSAARGRSRPAGADPAARRTGATTPRAPRARPRRRWPAHRA